MGVSSSTLDTRYSTPRRCDVLVIGGGGAGALAAIEASKDEKLRIMLLSKGPIGMSGLTLPPTVAQQGQVRGEPFQLMITTGRYLNDQDVAWFMTHEIKKSLERLKELVCRGAVACPVGCCAEHGGIAQTPVPCEAQTEHRAQGGRAGDAPLRLRRHDLRCVCA